MSKWCNSLKNDDLQICNPHFFHAFLTFLVPNFSVAEKAEKISVITQIYFHSKGIKVLSMIPMN